MAEKLVRSLSLVLMLALAGTASAGCMEMKGDTAGDTLEKPDERAVPMLANAPGANFAANTSHTCTIINDGANGESPNKDLNNDGVVDFPDFALLVAGEDFGLK